MFEFKTSEELREFILNRNEFEDAPQGISGPCHEMTWKKDHWVIRVQNKRVGEITQRDVPKGFDLRSASFVFDAMTILRVAGLNGINEYLKGLK